MATHENLNEKRTCWWCGASSKPLTLEHIVPLWLGEVLQGTGALNHTYTDPDDQSGGPTRSWRTMRPDLKARVACHECNNGWMSDLEHAAKRRVSPLIHGVPSRLSRIDCAVLARWASRTALMYQAGEKADDRVVPPEFFGALRGSANPSGLPTTLRVCVGTVEAHGAWSHAFAGTLRPPANATQTAPFFSTLLAFDR